MGKGNKTLHIVSDIGIQLLNLCTSNILYLKCGCSRKLFRKLLMIRLIIPHTGVERNIALCKAAKSVIASLKRER